MRYFNIFLITAILTAFAAICIGQEPEVIYSDDFSGYEKDGSLESKWSIFSGRWSVIDGALRQNAEGYDHGLIVQDLYLRCDYSLEVKTRLVNGGAGAGLYWNLYDPKTGDNADMLRLDGEGPMMYGYMSRRLFIRTGEPVGANMNDKQWHTMRLDVWNSRGKCDFYWDGKKIAGDMDMFYREGYVGLQCSIGQCEFDDFKITVAKGTQWKASPKYKVVPEISNVTQNSATIKWKSNDAEPTKIWLLEKPYRQISFFNQDYSSAVEHGDGKLRKSHKVKLAGLKPATQYTFAISKSKEEIKTEGNLSDYRFVTLPPKGMMAYTEVPLAVLVYCHVTNKDVKKPDGTPADPTLRDDKYFEQQVKFYEAMRYFYLINSMFRLDTKCKYLKVTRPVDASQLGYMTEEISKDLEELAKREGLKPEDFAAVIVVGGAGYYAYPWPTPWWDKKLDYTTGCCFVGGGDTWLGTHEFHHLTEGWMCQIGFPVDAVGGYGHADRPWHQPGNVGENYDFLAHTLRYIPKETYLKLAVGNLKLTADNDEDGVPDDEPNIIFDEKRGGTSPNDKNSYKNGLNDLQNLTAQIFTPAVKGHKHPMLTKQINLKYPFAVHNYVYDRKKKTPRIDGKIDINEWDSFVSSPNAVTPPNTSLPWGTAYPPVPGANYTMQTYLNWDDNYLYFAAYAPYKFLMSVQLDGDADGYFTGKENVRMTVQIPRDETTAPPNQILPPPEVMVWNNVEPVEQNDMPVWTNELYDKKDDIKWAWGKNNNGSYIIEIAIPKCENAGLIPSNGKVMGVRFWMQGFLPPTEQNEDPRYTFEMFEPCEYGYFRLVN